ncbi:MAG: glycosyltransferase family protein [Acetatifactor sp.]|nr:glycosyltransferase family protein [Acetatifactor sp.]
MRVSIVCCYNDADRFGEFCDSLESQTEKAELIVLDNREGMYGSCAKALNDGVKRVKTEFVVFAHQDILFRQTDDLERFVDHMDRLQIGDILGVAGATKEDKGVYTNVCVNVEGEFAGALRVNGIMKVQSVDECFFGGKTDSFIRFPFDEKICDNWHLYAIDWALDAARRGNVAYVCDVSITHPSKGNINCAYNVGFLKLCQKYSADTDFIRTTIVFSKTGFWHRWYVFLKHEAGRTVRRMRGL